MISSASCVVNPAPENAESDRNDATSLETPVIVSATVPIRTMSNESDTTIINEISAYIGSF
ncbi:hypothetical protein [Halopelagius fulvigenes]|uniref:Uncharacterized protein n=1 Tax=Halopelagius fulvigenes TaxID=1198324 RepID=A0ABD5TY02_9EURY